MRNESSQLVNSIVIYSMSNVKVLTTITTIFLRIEIYVVELNYSSLYLESDVYHLSIIIMFIMYIIFC